jgi:hypothetical protein
MKRWAARCLLVGSAVLLCTPLASAAQKQKHLFRLKRAPVANVEGEEYGPRYVRVPNVQNYVFRGKDGRIHVRKVPSGYAEGFPTPALFYYGYPHSGDDTGLGF